MNRVTQKEVARVFANFLGQYGLRPAKAYNDVGGYVLSSAPIYGGYVIEQVMNEGGGVTQPFGSERHSGREFVEMLRFAMRISHLRVTP